MPYKTRRKNGYSVVEDLCGHGVGIEFHEEPSIHLVLKTQVCYLFRNDLYHRTNDQSRRR